MSKKKTNYLVFTAFVAALGGLLFGFDGCYLKHYRRCAAPIPNVNGN